MRLSLTETTFGILDQKYPDDMSPGNFWPSLTKILIKFAIENFDGKFSSQVCRRAEDEAGTSQDRADSKKPRPQLKNANPSSTLGYLSQQPPATTHTELIAKVNNLLKMRQTIESLLSKTINELTNQSSDLDTFCPRDRIKELEIRTKQRNNFEEELFKDIFPTEEELAYHKELLGESCPFFSSLEPKIRRGDHWSLKIPCVIGIVYTGHAYIDLHFGMIEIHGSIHLMKN
ncbi:hypothetical protein Tco_0674963 [Tanacetum coccineum]